MELNDRIRDLLQGEFVGLVGFADLSAYQDELARGGPIARGYRRAVSIGVPLPSSLVDFLPQAEDPNVACAYKTHGYHVVNDRLDAAASKLSSFLNGLGHRTLPLPAAERTDEKNARATVSHKMVAHISGLGWIGKSCLLVTPQFGPRVRFTSVLTDAPLEAVDSALEQRCGTCQECRKICPAQAILGVNYVAGAPREDRFDFRKCQDHFDRLKATRTWDVCGLCLYVCPWGRKAVG